MKGKSNSIRGGSFCPGSTSAWALTLFLIWAGLTWPPTIICSRCVGELSKKTSFFKENMLLHRAKKKPLLPAYVKHFHKAEGLIGYWFISGPGTQSCSSLSLICLDCLCAGEAFVFDHNVALVPFALTLEYDMRRCPSWSLKVNRSWFSRSRKTAC